MTGTITTRRKHTAAEEGIHLIRLDLGRNEAGKRVRHVETFRGPKKLAQQRLRDLLKDHDTGRWTEPSARPLREFLNQWLEVAVKARVTKKTVEDYRTMLRLYVLPSLGSIALNRITPIVVQRLYQELSEGGEGAAGRKGTWPPLSAVTVRKVHTCLHQAMRQAVKWRMLAYPPTEDVALPRAPRDRKVRALSKAQIDAFLTAASTDRWAVLWLLCVHSGCRPEELFGLTWGAVLWNQSAIAIEQVLVRPRQTKGGPSWWLDAPKTKCSRRVVTLPLPVMRALEKHRLKQNEEKAFFGADYQDRGFVFACQHGQPANHNRVVRQHFKPILVKAGLPPETRLYDLRHSHASLHLAYGTDAKTVSERMGHASVAFTLDTYVHLVEDQQKEAAKRMEALFYGESAG